MLKKNTAVEGFPIGLFINASTGAIVTTGTPTCKRILDGIGAACTNAASYNSDAGQWEIDLAAADTNGAMVGLSFTLTDCLPITYRFRTVTVDLNDSVRGGMTALPNAAAGANGGLPLGDANARVSVGSWLDQAVTVSVGNKPQVDAYSISGDSVAADNFETMLDGTGGKTLSLGCLSVVYPGGEGYAVEIMNEYGTGTFFGNGVHVHGTVQFYGDEGGKAINFYGRNVAFSVASPEGDPCGFVTNDEYLGAYRQLHLLEQPDSGDTILARASDATDAVTAIEAYGDTKWLTATAFATQGDITGLAQYGDLNWTTATGFATPTNVTDAVTAIESHGDTNWGTATGFATPTNLNNVAVAIHGHITDSVGTLATSAELAAVDSKIDDVLEDTGETLPAAMSSMQSHGDSTWSTATSVTVSDKTGFSLAADQSGVTIGTVGTVTNAVAATNATLAKLETMLEADGSNYKFSSDSLQESPAVEATAEDIANAIAVMDMSSVEAEAAAWSLCTYVLAKFSGSWSGTELTIYRSDGETEHATATVATDTYGRVSSVSGLQLAA